MVRQLEPLWSYLSDVEFLLSVVTLCIPAGILRMRSARNKSDDGIHKPISYVSRLITVVQQHIVRVLFGTQRTTRERGWDLIQMTEPRGYSTQVFRHLCVVGLKFWVAGFERRNLLLYWQRGILFTSIGILPIAGVRKGSYLEASKGGIAS